MPLVEVATAWEISASSNLTTGNFEALNFQNYNCFGENNQYDLFTWCSSSSRIDLFTRIIVILEIKSFKVFTFAINRFENFHPSCDLDSGTSRGPKQSSLCSNQYSVLLSGCPYQLAGWLFLGLPPIRFFPKMRRMQILYYT
jgi:hypothetical protein